nr:DUF881 domain-containing protein [Sedimentibacter sp.]
MKKAGQKAILFIISVALGIFIIMQYQTTQNILGNAKTQNEKSTDLNKELAELSIEKSKLREEVDQLRDEVKANEEKSLAKENQINEIKDELNKQKILSGYYDVKGPGAIITINSDPSSYVNLAYSHQYILALISYLNNAGVEAISINGQRYTNYTEVVPVLDHINVNGVALVLPLEIKAIGNSRTIEASLNFVGGIVTQMTEIGFTIDTEYLDEVEINRYEGEKEFKYAVPVDTSDFE